MTKLDDPLELKLIQKKLYPSKSSTYLAIKVDWDLNWKQHIHDIAVILNRANAVLYTTWNYVAGNILRTIYFARFDTDMNYAHLIWH